MAIFSTTDLINDVGRAANPLRKSEAIHRLESLSLSEGSPAVTHNALSHAYIHKENQLSFNHLNTSTGIPSKTLPSHQEDGVSVFRKFESFILQTCFEILLPKAGHGAYGADQAGDTWRSLMAEQLGEQLSKSDTLGMVRMARHSVEQYDNVSSRSRIDFVMPTENS